MQRPLLTALVSELARHGISEHRVEHGGKHPRLCFSVAGSVQHFVMPGTGFDGPARYVYVGELRKLLRRLGVPKPPRVVSERQHWPAERRAGSRRRLPIFERVHVKDPFAALAHLAIATPLHADLAGHAEGGAD